MNSIEEQISIILVAGGVGSRMMSDIPKQFLQLNGKPIIFYSLELFSQIEGVSEIIVVCDPSYSSLVESYSSNIELKFASPGARRQDSVQSGFQKISPNCTLAVIHDAARPFVTLEIIRNVIASAKSHGAATAGMPLKFTIKEADNSEFVKNTPDRSTLWEIQTPQAIHPALLAQGFEKAIGDDILVTDDVGLIELLGLPVKLVKGSYSNIKITTPEDLLMASQLINSRHISS